MWNSHSKHTNFSVRTKKMKSFLYLSINPKAGKLIEEFGGIRKIEWKNKSEYRIYFHPGTKNLPLIIIAIFRKQAKSRFSTKSSKF